MFILVLLFVTSAHGDWVWSDDCNNDPIDDGEREAIVRYDKNLTSLMDPGEGCRWIFKSGSTECCYSDDTDQCEYETHNKEKCRKNHTEFIVHPTYPIRKCVLQLFNIGHKDAGEYTQTTRTFNFTIKLTVTRNKDWEIPTIYILSTICGAIIFASLWKLITWKSMKRKKDEKRNLILSLLKYENGEAFKLLSHEVDVWRAKDKDGNNLLHLIGMLYWTEKKTNIIYNYCQNKNLFDQQMDSEQTISLQSTDKIAKIVSLSFMKNIVKAKNKMDETPLHIAVKYGKRKVVEAMLTISNVDVNATDQHLWTPLHHASFKGHTEVIKILLDRPDIEKDAEASDGRTPLLCAGSGGKDTAFEVLFKHGAQSNVTTEDGENILHIVSKKSTVNENKGKIEILKFILKHTEELDSQEKQQMKKTLFTAIAFFHGTPLEVACSSGFFQAARLLIENGADFRTKLDADNQKQELHLLLCAVLKGDKEFADFLLKKDPNLVNAKTETDESYLHVATENLNVNAVILLLNLKIDKDAKNSDGKTALEFAEAKLYSCLGQSLRNSPNENILVKIISELDKERNDISKKNILVNMQKSTERRKTIKQTIKEIELKKQEETEVYMKETEVYMMQLKKATREEKGWKKALKDLEGESDIEEIDQQEKKRENPSMEIIHNRVTDMINSRTRLTFGQMAQVLKILNDVAILGADTGNRFLMPNSKRNKLIFQSD